MSQSAVPPEHCAFDVQPARHVKSPGRQMGCAVPQSALLRQLTHWPEPAKQRGCAAGQSALVSHSTHCDVVGSQIVPIPPIATAAVQSAFVLQPTHAPLLPVVSQIGALA